MPQRKPASPGLLAAQAARRVAILALYWGPVIFLLATAILVVGLWKGFNLGWYLYLAVVLLAVFGVASGWSHSRLSEQGRRQAGELGERRRDDGIAAVFSSDLRRAVETADIAFPSGAPPILLDWRLRECDYGERNGDPAEAHGRDRAAHVDEPFPGG